jgi:hypothetical protein
MCELKIADFIQIGIGIILFITLIIFSLNLILFWKQNCLTQTLNQPLCAVKEVRVEKVRDNVVQISVITKNYGKYVAKNVSIEQQIDVIEGIKDVKTTKSMDGLSPLKKTPITILPEQEFLVSFLQFSTDDFNKIARGYDSMVRVKVVIEYPNMHDKTQRYSCTYLITRLADIKEDKYEVSLQESKLETP